MSGALGGNFAESCEERGISGLSGCSGSGDGLSGCNGRGFGGLSGRNGRGFEQDIAA